MAMPWSSAARITSSSRIEPPGWITAVAPASIATRRPSANGKKASDATTAPLVSGSDAPACLAVSAALWAAMRAASTRLIWPAPIPTVAPCLAYTMVFDLTCLATRNANAKSASSELVGARVGQAAGDQQAQILLGPHDGDRFRSSVRRDDHLGEDLGHGAGRGGVERAVERHDAPIGRDRIAGQRLAIGFVQALCLRHPAR